MTQENKPFPTKHLFVCTNTKEKGESCGAKNSTWLRDELKKKCKGLNGLRVNAAGCLGQCERGIAAVIYPEGKWLLNLLANEETANSLCESLRNALADSGFGRS